MVGYGCLLHVWVHFCQSNVAVCGCIFLTECMCERLRLHVSCKSMRMIICFCIHACIQAHMKVHEHLNTYLYKRVCVSLSVRKRQKKQKNLCVYVRLQDAEWLSWKPGNWQAVCLDLHLSSTTLLYCSAGWLGSLQTHAGTRLHTCAHTQLFLTFFLFPDLSLSLSFFSFIFSVTLSYSLLLLTFFLSLLSFFVFFPLSLCHILFSRTQHILPFFFCFCHPFFYFLCSFLFLTYCFLLSLFTLSYSVCCLPFSNSSFLTSSLLLSLSLLLSSFSLTKSPGTRGRDREKDKCGQVRQRNTSRRGQWNRQETSYFKETATNVIGKAMGLGWKDDAL